MIKKWNSDLGKVFFGRICETMIGTTELPCQLSSIPHWISLNSKYQHISKIQRSEPPRQRSALLLGKQLGDWCPILGPHPPAISRDGSPISQATESSAANPPHSRRPLPVAIGSIWQWFSFQKIPSSTVPTKELLKTEGLWVLKSECTLVWRDRFSLMYASFKCHGEQRVFCQDCSIQACAGPYL